jgi:transposase-like protein
VSGIWKYLYRAVDQFGQVIGVMLSQRRDRHAARRFFQAALASAGVPLEVTTDPAPVYPSVLDELLAGASHNVEKYANNRLDWRLKARLRPMRGLKTDRSVAVIAVGQAFIPNLRGGNYELGMQAPAKHRLADAFDELALAV